MLKTKSKFKLLLALGILLLVLCVFNMNTVNATEFTSEDSKVFVQDELISGLINSVEKWENGNNDIIYYIEQNPTKTLDLILDTQRLNNLIEADNYVYQKIYYKVEDNVTKATITYNPFKSTKEQEVNIVTINNTRYAEIKLAVAIKIDGVYSHIGINGDGIGTMAPNARGRLKLYNNSEVIENIVFDNTVSEDFDEFNMNSATVSITSDTDKEYEVSGAGWPGACGITYNRIMAEGNCYVNVNIGTYVGKTFELKPFGTLTYKGTSGDDNYTSYTYQMKITDKTVFNKDSIICVINSKEHKILSTSVLFFEGNLIKAEDIKLNDKTTNITLEADTNVVPKDTILVVNTVNNNHPNYQQVMNIFQKSRNFKVFDIKLESNGAVIQPNGKVKISIPVPDNFDKSNLVVYRIEEDGTKIEYTVTVNGDVATFETDHFSTYVLAENNVTIADTNTNNNTNKEKDNTPKTGNLDIINYVLVVTSLAGLGIILFKKHS